MRESNVVAVLHIAVASLPDVNLHRYYSTFRLGNSDALKNKGPLAKSWVKWRRDWGRCSYVFLLFFRLANLLLFTVSFRAGVVW